MCVAVRTLPTGASPSERCIALTEAFSAWAGREISRLELRTFCAAGLSLENKGLTDLNAKPRQ
jgi:hypothetical protein